MRTPHRSRTAWKTASTPSFWIVVWRNGRAERPVPRPSDAGTLELLAFLRGGASELGGREGSWVTTWMRSAVLPSLVISNSQSVTVAPTHTIMFVLPEGWSGLIVRSPCSALTWAAIRRSSPMATRVMGPSNWKTVANPGESFTRVRDGGVARTVMTEGGGEETGAATATEDKRSAMRTPSALLAK